MIGIAHLPEMSLDISFPSQYNAPATQRWPIPSTPLLPTRAISEHPTCSIPGGRSANERSPLSPRFLSRSPVRHGVPIAELVDEEDSSPGTRGGVNPPYRPVATHVNMSAAQNYPLITISIVDVTPRPTRGSGGPEAPGIRSSRSSTRSPLVSPGGGNRLHTAGGGGKTPRRSTLRGVLLTAPEVPNQRVTRSSVKRKATEDSKPSKRMKTSSPQ